MGKLTGFMEYPRQTPGYRPLEERVRDYKPVELALPEEDLVKQAARCMDCGVPFCHGCGCPLNNIIPEWNDLAYRGKWREALDLLLATDNFPEFTGRICPAPCEGSCVLGINKEPVAIRQIERTIIEKGFELGYVQPRLPAVRFDQRVAVIGSGPAGLAAADCLNRAGYRVVVYDDAAKPGGILRYGIPDFKLEKSVVDRRVRLMEAEGVVFECRTVVGEDLSYRYLKSRFDAICFSAGAREARELKVPGRELAGIRPAMDFLTQQNMRLGGEPVDPAQEVLAGGRHVLVIGGGDTGSDCVGTSIRQGAASVTQVEILPKPPETRSPGTPWPQWPHMLRVSSSHLEGCDRRWAVATQAFTGKDGRVTGVKCVEVEWQAPEGGGRPVMKTKAGSEFTLAADLVLLAMGFTGPVRNAIIDSLPMSRDAGGNLCRDARNMTSVEGIFVSGDMSQGASLVVRAIADGRKAAAGIAAYLAERR